MIAIAAYLAYNRRTNAAADVSEATVDVSEGMTFVHDDVDDLHTSFEHNTVRARRATITHARRMPCYPTAYII